MSLSFIEAYYTNKINNVLEYLKCVLKSVEDRKYMNVEKYFKIVEKYVLDGMKDKEKITDKVDVFLNHYNITHYKLKNIVNYVIKYLDSAIASDVYSNADKMIYISKMIYLSVELETKSTIFIYPNNKYTSVLNKVLQENKKIFSKEEINKITACSDDIEEILKENMRVQREFAKKINNPNFKIFIDTIFYDEDKKCNFYNLKFEYKIPSIKRYTEKEINESIEKYELNLELKKVEIELLELEVLKLLFKEKEDFKILLTVTNEQLEDANFIKFLFEKFSVDKFRNHVILLVDYITTKKNKVLIESFSDSMIKIAGQGIQDFSNNYSYFRFMDYFVITEEDMKTKEYKEFLKQESINLKIIEV